MRRGRLGHFPSQRPAVQAFLAALAGCLAPGGLMVLSCPNRTPQSKLLMVEGAERLGLIPRGTHHWEDFVTPEELAAKLQNEGGKWMAAAKEAGLKGD